MIVYGYAYRNEDEYMIKSMTGFGRAEVTDEKRTVVVEIRSVNHRYCDINVKMARRYAFAEEKIKSTIKEVIKRGKLDVSVMVENLTESDVTIKLNDLVAKQYVENFKILKESYGLSGELSLDLLAQQPDVMRIVPDVEDQDEVLTAILEPVRLAATNLDEMRVAEGKKLEKDMLERGEVIKGFVAEISERAPAVPKEYAERLKQRIATLLEDATVASEERIAVEAAIFADKCNIDEEITRLNSHMEQMKKIIDEQGQPDGKRLDFLVQEMNREANTIGSKANDLSITERMLKIKAEVEKIREQVQNIE